MQAGNERDALLRVADQLSEEVGYAAGVEVPGPFLSVGGAGGAMAGILNSEDEQLVARVRQRLAEVAATLDGALDDASVRAIVAALDGTEMVLRGELVLGNARRLPALLPDLVFLVVLPVVGQDPALELSKRAALLVEQELT